MHHSLRLGIPPDRLCIFAVAKGLQGGDRRCNDTDDHDTKKEVGRLRSLKPDRGPNHSYPQICPPQWPPRTTPPHPASSSSPSRSG
eukprot:3637313-Pyramimonas_sp.AAC.1